MHLFYFYPELVPPDYFNDAIILIIFFSKYMFHLMIFSGRRVDCLSFRIPYVFMEFLYIDSFLSVSVCLTFCLSFLVLLYLTILQLTIPCSLERSIQNGILHTESKFMFLGETEDIAEDIPRSKES